MPRYNWSVYTPTFAWGNTLETILNRESQKIGISEEEWEDIKDCLYPGCYFSYTGIHTHTTGVVNNRGGVDFKDNTQNYSLQDRWNGILEYTHDFKHSDGRPLVVPSGKKKSPVLRKILSLALRFKNKTLPKVANKIVPLSLPK